MRITDIASSRDLAILLNESTPLTTEDAAEGPLQWGGIALLGAGSYTIDEQASSDTRCVLEVNAAVDYRRGFHDCPMYRTEPAITRAHWCPAEYEGADFCDGGEVVRDWREVTLSQGQHVETDLCDTVEQARQHYTDQCAWFAQYEQDMADEIGLDEV